MGSQWLTYTNFSLTFISENVCGLRDYVNAAGRCLTKFSIRTIALVRNTIFYKCQSKEQVDDACVHINSNFVRPYKTCQCTHHCIFFDCPFPKNSLIYYDRLV